MADPRARPFGWKVNFRRNALSRYGRFILIVSLLFPFFSTQLFREASAARAFQETWGGNGFDTANGVALDPYGNIYVAGTTNSSGAGGYDVLLLKYNSSGILVWARTWGGSGSDFGTGLATDSHGTVYITGRTYSFGFANSYDAFLLKFDPFGTLLWQKTWGGNGSDASNGIAIDSKGNVYLTGQVNSSTTGLDAFFLKFNSLGGLSWQKCWGGNGTDVGTSIDLDTKGNIFAVGRTSGNVFLLELNSLGWLQWDRSWGGANTDRGLGVVADSSENVYVTGSTSSFGAGSDDAFLLKFNSTGEIRWRWTWGGNRTDFGTGVALDPYGYVYVTGTTYSFGSGSSDIFLLRFSLSGTLISDDILGGISSDQGSAVVADFSGNAYIAGYVSESPPYTDGPGNSTVGTPILALKSPPFPITDCTNPLGTPNGSVSAPIGNSGYAGGADALLLRVGSEIVGPTSIFSVRAAMVVTLVAAISVVVVRRRKASPAFGW